MSRIDLDELREHPIDGIERGTPEQIAVWRQDVAEARANLVIEDLTPTVNEDEMFAVMLDEGVPPSLMTTIILGLHKPIGGVELRGTPRVRQPYARRVRECDASSVPRRPLD